MVNKLPAKWPISPKKGRILAQSAVFSVQKTRYEANVKIRKYRAEIVILIALNQAKTSAKGRRKMTKWLRNRNRIES